MTGRVLRFALRTASSEEGLAAARGVLKVPISERRGNAVALKLEDPETLLSVCFLLRQQMDTSPVLIREEAEFFYRFLLQPRRDIGLFDEREYFLGEMALI